MQYHGVVSFCHAQPAWPAARFEVSDRKPLSVAILFADVCRSTQLFEQYGDVQARELVAAAIELMSRSTQRYQGRVVKTIGDEVMAVLPNADRAVLAAVDMQKQVSNDPFMRQHDMGIKVGFHQGPVLEEDDDVYGDAVNVAARMVSNAKCEQIITNSETLGQISPLTGARTRSLGRSKVAGKSEMLELLEILWQEDPSSITTVSKTLGNPDLFSEVRLSLRFSGNVIHLDEKTYGFSMGRDGRNQLVVDNEWVSRNHATIEFRKRSFVLTDSSTNGTWLQQEGEEPFFLHRDQIPLHKQGVICLGQAIDLANPMLIHYQCKY